MWPIFLGARMWEERDRFRQNTPPTGWEMVEKLVEIMDKTNLVRVLIQNYFGAKSVFFGAKLPNSNPQKSQFFPAPQKWYCKNVDDCATLKHGCGALGLCILDQTVLLCPRWTKDVLDCFGLWGCLGDKKSSLNWWFFRHYVFLFFMMFFKHQKKWFPKWHGFLIPFFFWEPKTIRPKWWSPNLSLSIQV